MRPCSSGSLREVDPGHDVLRAERDLLGLGEEVVDAAVEHQPADRRGPARCSSGMSLVASSTSNSNFSANASSNSCSPSSHSGKSPASMASHRSRRWKSGSAPLIFTASFQTTDCSPSFGFQWNLTNVDLPVGVDQPEGVDAEALHEAERARDRPVGHDPHDHVHALGRERDEVPEVVVRGLRLREAAVRLRLGGVDQVGELDRVLDEEDRDVVADEVPVALLGVELHGEAAHVAGQVGRALAAGDGREADERRRLLAGALEQVGPGDVGQRARSSRSSRARRSRGRGRPARGCARGRSGRSSRGNGSPPAAPGRAPDRSEFWSSATARPAGW